MCRSPIQEALYVSPLNLQDNIHLLLGPCQELFGSKSFLTNECARCYTLVCKLNELNPMLSAQPLVNMCSKKPHVSTPGTTTPAWSCKRSMSLARSAALIWPASPT